VWWWSWSHRCAVDVPHQPLASQVQEELRRSEEIVVVVQFYDDHVAERRWSDGLSHWADSGVRDYAVDVFVD
jgi:hypothetical protein